MAYLLRDLSKRVHNSGLLSSYRLDGFSSELAEQFRALSMQCNNTTEFMERLCNRFMVDPMLSVHGWPLAAWWPHGRTPWIWVCAHVEMQHLALFSAAGMAPFLVQFALMPYDMDREDADWILLQEVPIPEPKTYASFDVLSVKVPKTIWRSQWTALSNVHHGADQKFGNVALVRRELQIDPVLGRDSSTPFLSGNSIRGMLRDMAIDRQLELLGMNKFEVNVKRAHAMYSGGTIESGANTAKVLVEMRRNIRRLIPAWDLLGGVMEAQTMDGVLVCHDGLFVCKENAWRLRHGSTTREEFEAFRSGLPSSFDLTQVRQHTRFAHRELDVVKHADGTDAKSAQMLVAIEACKPGSRIEHSFTIRGGLKANQITLSCMADLLECLRDFGHAGAQNARGFGLFSFGEYTREDGMELPSPELYRAFLRDNAEEIKAWLKSEPSGEKPDALPKAEKPAKAKSGAKGKKAVEITTDPTPIDFDETEAGT